MSYRRILVRRWSRRDRLAIAMIALTVAFLTGSTLLIVAVSTQPVGLADSFNSPGTATVLDTDTPSDNGVTFPIATVTKADGTSVTVVGVPATAAESWNVPPPPDEGFIRGEGGPESVQLNGRSGSIEATVEQYDTRSLFPASWYITTPEVVTELGPTNTLVLTDEGTYAPATGVPLRSVLGFFLAGQSQLLAMMGTVVSGGAVLIAVTVYSITRISVRDRLATIRTARATGATPRDILGTFALRATVLTAVGSILGYALGVILPNIAISVAVSLGFMTTIDLSANAQVLYILVPTYIGLVIIGALTGGFAAWSVVRDPPAQLSTRTEGHGSSGLVLLDYQILVPTTATLSVFMAVLFVVSALVLTAAPVATAGGTTISQPGSPHPIASQLPTGYADALEANGINASAEIVGFAIVDGQPFLTRGAGYESFASVTDANLTKGRVYTSPNEAVIGTSLARTLNVDVGQTLTLGGSIEDGVARVTIVGMYTAPGAYEDQLLLPRPTARHLAGLDANQVNVIRTAESLEGNETAASVTVLDVSVPGRAAANDTATINMTVRNHGTTERSHTVTATLGDRQVEKQITLASGEQRTVKLSLPTGVPGKKTVQINENTNRTITIIHPEAPRLDGVPSTAPPGSNPLINVRTATGTPIANTTVTIAENTVTTRSNGTVRLPVGSAGTREVRVETEHGTATTTIEVTANAERNPITSVGISPASPTTLATPQVHATFYNPWDKPIETMVRIVGPGTTVSRQLHLAAGERTKQQIDLTRQPPGTYDVQVKIGDTTTAETSYEVSGNERVAAALASSDYTSSGSSLGQAIEAVIGNITLLLGVLGSLAVAMTIGGLSAAMARAVHARRKAIGIHRAIGASPRGILQPIMRDALVIGVVGTISAFVVSLLIIRMMSFLGLLTVYGISIPPLPTPRVALFALVTGVGLTLCSAMIAVGPLLYRQPAVLLTGKDRTTKGDTYEN